MADLHLEIDDLWDYNDPAGSEAKFREALSQVDPRAGQERDLTLLTQIARTLGLQRKFDEAHQVLDQVEAQLETGGTVEVRYLLERGRAFNSSKKPEAAVQLFIKAVEIGKAAEADFYTVDALHMLGIAAPSEDRLDWNLAAIAYAEASSDERAQAWLGSLLNNTGWTYFNKGAFDTALSLFKRTRKFYQEEDRADMEEIARWSIGKTLRKLGRVAEALAVQQELAAEGSDGFIEEELAECLLALGETEASKFYFQQAHDTLSKIDWVAEDTERMVRLKSLAK